MPSGGARPGAGRPRTADKFKRPIARAEKRIADRLPLLIDKHFELAEGVSVLDDILAVPALLKALQAAGTDAEKVSEIAETFRQMYLHPPQFKSLEYLVNRIMGRPTEVQEVTIDDTRLLLD
jgi:hypothetical protein